MKDSSWRRRAERKTTLFVFGLSIPLRAIVQTTPRMFRFFLLRDDRWANDLGPIKFWRRTAPVTDALPHCYRLSGAQGQTVKGANYISTYLYTVVLYTFLNWKVDGRAMDGPSIIPTGYISRIMLKNLFGFVAESRVGRLQSKPQKSGGARRKSRILFSFFLSFFLLLRVTLYCRWLLRYGSAPQSGLNLGYQWIV